MEAEAYIRGGLEIWKGAIMRVKCIQAEGILCVYMIGIIGHETVTH